MKSIIYSEIFYQTSNGQILPTHISFKNYEDATTFVSTRNKNTANGRYICKPITKVCYESIEEFNSKERI